MITEKQIWWTPAELCTPEVRSADDLPAVVPCARGDFRASAKKFGQIARLGHRGAELRYFNESTTRNCFAALAASGSRRRTRVLLTGVSTISFVAMAASSNFTAAELHKDCKLKRSAQYQPHDIGFMRWNFIANRSVANSRGQTPRLNNQDCSGEFRKTFGTMPEYDAIFVQVGAWDATWGVSARAFEAALNSFIRAVRESAARTVVVLVAQTPEGHSLVRDARPVYGHNWKSLFDSTIELNRRVAAVAARWQVPYLDAHALAIAHPKSREPEFWDAGAGWHMQEPGPVSDAIWHWLLHTVCPA